MKENEIKILSPIWSIIDIGLSAGSAIYQSNICYAIKVLRLDTEIVIYLDDNYEPMAHEMPEIANKEFMLHLKSNIQIDINKIYEYFR